MIRAVQRTVHPLLAVALLALASGCAPEADPVEEGPGLDLPARPAGAPGGRAFSRTLEGLDAGVRDERVLQEVARGNVPGWLRAFERVETTVDAEDGAHDLVFWVTPDYMAVGSDDDFVFVPVSPGTARRIARLAGGSLPTPSMVDAIWRAAGTRLIPIRFRPDEEMGSVRYLVRHNRLIRAQRQQQDAPPGTFVAGHKLDVVRLAGPGPEGADLALYGWHHSDATPIQPLFPVDRELEPHYSMGVRVVDDEVMVDGVRVALDAVLGDPAGLPDR